MAIGSFNIDVLTQQSEQASRYPAAGPAAAVQDAAVVDKNEDPDPAQ
jgi:hypothetical protein